MHSPHPPRPGGDLPRRVPGSGKQVGDSSAPAADTRAADGARPKAPAGGPWSGDAPGLDTSLPRLTQFSSLGSRANAADSFPEPPAEGDSAGDRPEDRPRKGVRGRLGRRGDKAGREGLRGALGVVGVVGLLAAGAVALTLSLGGQEEGQDRGSGSVAVDTEGYGVDDVAGLGGSARPSASAPGGQGAKAGEGDKDDKGGKDGKGDLQSAKPSSTATPGGGASTTASSPAAGKAGAPAGGGDAPAGQSAPESVPGTGVFSHDSQRCIDIVGGQAVAGAGLMIWDCSGSASQHWVFPSDGTMRSLGLCVELAGGSTADGANLRMAPCDGGAAQRISLNSRHDVVSSLADKCVDVRDGLRSNGTRLQLWSCNGHDNQKWSTT